MNRLIQLKKETSLFVVALSLCCCAVWLVPNAFGVVPAPDGGYPGGNTAEGQTALFSLTTGQFNTAVGFFGLRANATGQFNTAVGAGALLANTADRNTATGAGALLTNGSGHDNTATGVFALLNNTTGHENTAHGGGTLFNNVDGSSNTAIGINALFTNASGGANTAVGGAALYNTISSSNTAVGTNALFNNATGADNTAVGIATLIANTAGNNNTALGALAGSALTGASNICIGASVLGGPGENNTIRIGDNLPVSPGLSACYIGGIYQQGFNNMSVLQVGIDNTGKVGTFASSRRFKKDIQPMGKTSETILALKPVTFHYKSDSTDTPQFGLLAEDVAEANPALIVRDKESKPYSVRYDQVNAMLLNEFLKEHKKVEQLQATVAQQQKAFQGKLAEQQKQIETLASVLQKVSDRLQLGKAAPRVTSASR